MMNEWNTPEHEQIEQGTLDDRLTAYYGQQLPEQPLPPESWYALSGRLSRQQIPRRAFRTRRQQRSRYMRPPSIRFWRYPRSNAVPAYIQDAFMRIVYEAHLPYPSSMLRCTFNERVRTPYTRVSVGGKGMIQLVLPSSSLLAIESTELNVLLASGLACHLLLHEQKRMFMVARILVVCACLLALLWLFLFGERDLVLMVIPLAILAVMVVVAHYRGRKFAFRVDALTVRWLGRSQVCEGLHALLKRNRHPRRRGIGQVSMIERIQRVCGVQVPDERERLTLVR